MLVVTTGGTALAGPTSAGIDRRVVQEGLDEFVQAGALGVQVRVTGDRRQFTARSGVADLGSHRPVPPNGRFRAGSITKTFAATVALQLAGEDTLDLDAPVVRYLPGLVDHRITVRDLLQHTSGLYNFTETVQLDPDVFEPIRYQHWEPEEVLRIATSRPLDFEPGTKWAYSNTNYTVVGLLIEHVTGRTFEQEVQRRVLKPLRLDDTSLPVDQTAIPGPHARAYWTYQGKPSDITHINPSFARVAGNIISTTADLDTFVDALLDGRLLKPAQQAELLRTTAVSPRYGLGIEIDHLSCGTTVLGHSGGIPGFISAMYTTADTGKRVVLNATTAPDLADPTAAYDKLTTEIFC
ncbi:beta-lactamase [Nocardia sp. NRRL S-836]|nr:beta-lactamase [Nocardia sp. NRRL S-836]